MKQEESLTELECLLSLSRWTPKELATAARLLHHQRSTAGHDRGVLTAAAAAWSNIETDDSRLLNAAATAWLAAARLLADTDTGGIKVDRLAGKPLHLPVLVALASSSSAAVDGSCGGDGGRRMHMENLICLLVGGVHASVPLDYLVRALDLVSKHDCAQSHTQALWPFALNLLRHASLKAIRTSLLATTLRLIPPNTAAGSPIQFVLDHTLHAPAPTRLYLLATMLSTFPAHASHPGLSSFVTLAPTLLADPATGPAAAAFLVAHHAATAPPTTPPAPFLAWVATWLLHSPLPLYPRLVASPLLARFPAARKLAPQLISDLVAQDPFRYLPAAVAAVQALDLPIVGTWMDRTAHVHADTDTRQCAAELAPLRAVPLAWMGEPGVGPKPGFPWVLAGLRPGAGKCDVERSLSGLSIQNAAAAGQNENDQVRRAVLRALASPFASLRTLATRVRLSPGWSRADARDVWDEALAMLRSQVPAARDGAARFLAVVCRDHPEYVPAAVALVNDGEMSVGDVVGMNARLQLAADLRDVCGIEVNSTWSWEALMQWVQELTYKVHELVSARATSGGADQDGNSDDGDDDDEDDEEGDMNSDGSDAKHLLVTTWHTLVLVSSRLVTLALSAQPQFGTDHGDKIQPLFPLLARTVCWLRHAGAVQYVTRDLVRLFRGLPHLQSAWRAWAWTMLGSSASSSSTRLDTRYSGPRLVLRLVLDPTQPDWLAPLFACELPPHTALLLANGLLQDTALGPKVAHDYACAVLELALSHASNVDASVRSAAVKLVVNWSHRVLVLPNRSACELFVQRPKEAQALVQVLTEAPPRMGAVMGVLLVLAQVSLGSSAQNSGAVDESVVQALVKSWLAHPIAHVRRLAGVALARMATSVGEVKYAVMREVDQTLMAPQGVVGQNRVHGVLGLVGEMCEVQLVNRDWVRTRVEHVKCRICPVNELLRKQVLARVTEGGVDIAGFDGNDDKVDQQHATQPLISTATSFPDLLDLSLHSDPAIRLATASHVAHTLKLHTFAIPLAPYLTAWFVLRAMSHQQLVSIATRIVFPLPSTSSQSSSSSGEPSLVSLVKSRLIAPTRGQGREWEDPVVVLALVHLAHSRTSQKAHHALPKETRGDAEEACARFEREWDELVSVTQGGSAAVAGCGLQLQLAFHPAVWTRLVQYRVVCRLVGRSMSSGWLGDAGHEALQVLDAVEKVCCESVVAVEERMKAT